MVVAEPNRPQVSRAVVRIEAGKPVDAAEIQALLSARGEHLDRLMAVARRTRDAGTRDLRLDVGLVVQVVLHRVSPYAGGMVSWSHELAPWKADLA